MHHDTPPSRSKLLEGLRVSTFGMSRPRKATVQQGSLILSERESWIWSSDKDDDRTGAEAGSWAGWGFRNKMCLILKQDAFWVSEGWPYVYGWHTFEREGAICNYCNYATKTGLVSTVLGKPKCPILPWDTHKAFSSRKKGQRTFHLHMYTQAYMWV